MADFNIFKEVGIKVKDVDRNSESDVENKLVVPFLEKLGYSKSKMIFRVSKTIQIGSRDEQIIPDVVVNVEDAPFIVIEEKPLKHTIDERDARQAISSSRLYSLPKTIPYAITTNGTSWEVYDSYSGELIGDVEKIPSFKDAIEILKKGIPKTSEVRIEEAKRYINVIKLIDEEKLGELFGKCYTLISAEGKKFHHALEEISKILLVKIFEEYKSVQEERRYRFSGEFISEQLLAFPDKNATDIVNELFNEAIKKPRKNTGEKVVDFSGIFSKDDKILLRPGTVKKIVELLEPYAFYEVGEDLKGAVYETFLKEIFRGEKGQFFTPREIIKFMIELVNPQIGETVLDPAVGSGGFLIHWFLDVRKKILKSDLSTEAKEKLLKELVESHIWGADIDETLVKFCKINLLIHGDGYKYILKLDGLDKNLNKLKEDYFDCILTNPPFDLPSEQLEDIIEDYRLYKEKGYGGADVLYLERCYELLNEGGRLAIVLPHRFIDAKGFKNLREWILEKSVPRAIVTLPEGAFTPFGGSGARTCILYLRKPKNKKEKTGELLMANIRHTGYILGIKNYKASHINELEDIVTRPEFSDFKKDEAKAHGLS